MEPNLVYSNNGIAVYNSDSLSFLKSQKSNTIQLTVSSPPYFAYKNYGNDAGNIENFDRYEQYCEYINNWLQELYRITDEDGRVCIVIDDKHTNAETEGVNINRGTHARIINYAINHGFQYKDLIIWAKVRLGHASGGADKMLGSYPYPPNIPMVSLFEYILIFRKDGKKTRVSRVSTSAKESSKLSMKEFKWAAESIWYVPAEKTREHPAPFPETISNRLIKLFSFRDETVLDPFMGSGTTLISAFKNKRKAIGVDISRVYCDYAVNRLKMTGINAEANFKRYFK